MDLFLSCELTGLSLPPSQVHGSLAREPHGRLCDSGSPAGTAAPALRDPGLVPEGRQLPLSGLFSNPPSGKQHPTNPRGRSSPPGVPAWAPPCAALGCLAGFWQTAVSCT